LIQKPLRKVAVSKNLGKSVMQQYLDKLPKVGNVYMHDSPVYADSNWMKYQEREKKFWEYEVNRPTYNPDPVEHIKPSLKYWGIKTDFFKDKNVLEIGSGPFGFFSGVSRVNAGHLPATLVVSDSLMDFYQELKVSELIPPKSILLRSPGEDLPFPDKCFDVVLTNNTIDHVQDCDRLLSEIKRLLSPGAVLLFSSHIIVDCIKLLRPLIKQVDINHPNHFTLKEMEDMITRCGFRLKTKSTVPLHKEESIPPETTLIQKGKYFIGFRLLHTMYGVAVPY